LVSQALVLLDEVVDACLHDGQALSQRLCGRSLRGWHCRRFRMRRRGRAQLADRVADVGAGELADCADPVRDDPRTGR
jgi:hypothetical protein